MNKTKWKIFGETKTINEWMEDDRKHSMIGLTALYSRLKRGKMSPEEALTLPPYKKNEQKTLERKKKRLECEKKRRQQFAFAAMIRQLYEDGEHIDDLEKFFELERYKIQSIIRCKTWYNPSIKPCNIPKDYNRRQRRLPPSNVTKNKYDMYKDKKYGIYWNDGYFQGYAYLKYGKSIFSGKCDSAEEVAKILNEIYVLNGMDPPYKIG